MQNGTTYMVRPRMLPRNSSVMVARISCGAIQLLVGPASRSSIEQMNVRSSTLATSDGSDTQWNEFGLAARRVNVPAATSSSVSRVHSCSLPSAQTTASGRVSAATDATHSRTPSWALLSLSNTVG